jgi:hypothetical protein
MTFVMVRHREVADPGWTGVSKRNSTLSWTVMGKVESECPEDSVHEAKRPVRAERRSLSEPAVATATAAAVWIRRTAGQESEEP